MTASVVAGFGACLLGLGVLITTATRSTFDHERAAAEKALEAAAETQVSLLDTLLDGGVPLMEDLAGTDELGAFEPAGCSGALAPLASITTQARLVLVDPAGVAVCELSSTPGSGLPPRSVYEDALRGTLVLTSDPFIDPVSGQPSVAVAAPVTGEAGTGALVGVLFTGEPPLELSPAVDPSTVAVAVDDDLGVVIATTADAPYAVGDDFTLARPESVGPDGVRRLWAEVVSETTGRRVFAGVGEDIALASARDQRASLLQIGAAILGIVVLLAVALQRRLAGPIRRLGAAIAASRAGDEQVRAPETGPTEVADVARAFNEVVDAHQALADQLRTSARHDALTGLLNRRGATEVLERLLDDPAAEPLAVLFIDLDRFKLVNDSHGHSVGDDLLVELAHRLRAAVPAHWIVTRFGGDEFVVICPTTPDPVAHIDELSEVLRSRITVGAHELTVGGSIGIAQARPGQGADDLVREADTAMYRAKEQGRGGYAVFDDAMRAWTLARLTTERDLRGAVERDELVLHYQPVVDVASGAVVGAEALVRWQHPTLGLVPPGDFIPVAEETGLILEIGAWVAEEAARQSVARRIAGEPVRVSFNVAAAQLVRSDLVRVVLGAIGRAGADPGDLTIEVTESAVLADLEAAVAQLEAVRAAGVHVSIDDFGTGYSSLAYLQRLPADELKIDRSFVAPVADDRTSAAIVASVIDLAHAVGLEVVAEGVERPDQLEHLRSLGCDRAQGYHLGRPEPTGPGRSLATV